MTLSTLLDTYEEIKKLIDNATERGQFNEAYFREPFMKWYKAELKQAEEETLKRVKEVAEDMSRKYCLVGTGLDDCDSCYPLQQMLSELSEKNDDFCTCRESECPRKRHLLTEGEK